MEYKSQYKCVDFIYCQMKRCKSSIFSPQKPKNYRWNNATSFGCYKKVKITKFTKKAAKWSTNSTSQDCCILTSVKFTKKSCQMKWSQSFFIFGIFLVRKSLRQSWPHFIWQTVNLTHLYCNLYSILIFSQNKILKIKMN